VRVIPVKGQEQAGCRIVTAKRLHVQLYHALMTDDKM
jgi:hypothetical protein